MIYHFGFHPVLGNGERNRVASKIRDGEVIADERLAVLEFSNQCHEGLQFARNVSRIPVAVSFSLEAGSLGKLQTWLNPGPKMKRSRDRLPWLLGT